MLEIRDGVLTIAGMTRLNAAGRDYRLYAEDGSGSKYNAEIIRYSRSDITGFLGEVITEGYRYVITIPAQNLSRITLRADIEGATVDLVPAFDKYIGLGGDCESEYIIKGGNIIRLSGGSLTFEPETMISRFMAERKYSADMTAKEGPEWKAERKELMRHRKEVRKAPLQKRVAFVTTRSDDKLIDNTVKVYDMLDLPKVMFAKTELPHEPEYIREAERIISTSKVVVTDNYLVTLRDYEKKPGQKYVQLWHSTGFAKHFGQDGSDIFPTKDALFHRDYDLVIASSDGVRYTYASAFGIPADRVEATGSPRTDDFFNEEYIEKTKQKVMDQHPELRDRQVILYAPTFRDVPGVPRSRFLPELDFGELSQQLKPDQIFVLCPHPLMTERIVPDGYDNVCEIRDITTAQMMYAADILISDYSSVMFDYSLLRRPMAFFCYDYDGYDRDFYMDFDHDLPGPILKNQDELFDYLRQDEHPLIEDFDAFYEKNLGACDGHSTERVVARITDLYNED